MLGAFDEENVCHCYVKCSLLIFALHMLSHSQKDLEMYLELNRICRLFEIWDLDHAEQRNARPEPVPNPSIQA